MQHASLGVVLVATLEVVARVHCHVARRYVDILIVRDIDASRIVHFIIGTRSDGERRDGTLAVVEYGIDVGWKDALVVVVDLNGRVGPPEEGLG